MQVTTNNFAFYPTEQLLDPNLDFEVRHRPPGRVVGVPMKSGMSEPVLDAQFIADRDAVNRDIQEMTYQIWVRGMSRQFLQCLKKVILDVPEASDMFLYRAAYNKAMECIR